MNSADRLNLIRSKLAEKAHETTKPKGIHRASNPTPERPKKPGKRTAPRGWNNCAFAGPIMPYSTNSVKGWVYSPDPKAKKEKQFLRREPHHLNQIAEKWLHAPKPKAKV